MVRDSLQDLLRQRQKGRFLELRVAAVLRDQGWAAAISTGTTSTSSKNGMVARNNAPMRISACTIAM